MSNLKASIIVPARNESAFINIFLERLIENLKSDVEILIVVDSEEDSTLTTLREIEDPKIRLRKLISTYGTGPANAIRFGINSAQTGIVVITMADGSDDPRDVDDLILLIERGCSIAVASRYMPGGQQIGGPKFKKVLAKNASRTLRLFAGVSTHDATNSFKAYSKNFISEVKIESRNGFEVGLELVAKAHRNKLLIAEIPTIWIDRFAGTSNFKIRKWLPHYLYWFFYAFGKKINSKESK